MMAQRVKPRWSESSHRAEHERWCVTCPGSRFEFADEPLTCRKCGAGFVFTAEQQRYWYVDLELIEAAKPPRLCQACGRHRHTGRHRQNRLAAAVLAARQRPDDAAVLLELAAAVAGLVAHTGRGGAAQGVAAARRARAVDPKMVEAWYWEAACHDGAGRFARAQVCYRRFVAEASVVRRLRKLVGRAAHRAYELVETELPPEVGDRHACSTVSVGAGDSIR